MGTELDTVLREIGEVRSFVLDKVKAGVAPLVEENIRVGEALKKLTADLQEIRRQRVAALSSDGRLMVPDGRLAGYTPLDLAVLRGIMQRRYERVRGGDDAPIMQELRRAEKALRGCVTPESLLAWEERALKTRRAAYGFSDYNPGALKFTHELGAWRNQMMHEVRKALDSTTAAAGDELVATLEAAELWMDVNLDTVILPALHQIPMPSSPFDMPAQLGDVNWYPIVENVANKTTTVTTAKATLTAYGLRAGVPFSDEVSEDAVIALIPEIRRNLAMNAAEVIDDVLLNGDTTATNGINSDGVTIATDTAGKAQWLLGFDGLIHLAIVDNSANQSRNVNGTVTADAFNAVLAKLGKYAAPKRRGDVIYISDVNTAIRSLSIAEFETVDVAGVRATLSSGEILNVYGKPYLHSEQMKLADTDGKVTDSGGNTVGRILVLNTSQWRVGFRRQISIEPDREPGKGQTTLYVTFRIALTERSGTRSTATHTAINYNITGVA